MIPLKIEIEVNGLESSMVVRLKSVGNSDTNSQMGRDAEFVQFLDGWLHYRCDNASFKVKGSDPKEFEGDVIAIHPNAKLTDRLIRAQSMHNTFLVTERCDQLCVMCSQPPKEHHVDRFDVFTKAALLAPPSVTIGITGGEPMLYKDRLFEMLEVVFETRPDIKFHILTNGQHFSNDDIEFLSSPLSRNVLWAIPIYSADSSLHDRIVGKDGAFKQLITSLIILSLTTAAIELRTVVLKSNIEQLPALADFISRNIPFAEFWAIMQLERIGYGRLNWGSEFFDTSINFNNIANALNVVKARGGEVRLYNFPLCSIPADYRGHNQSSISDWKKKYLPSCDGCSQKQSCGGFFEWYLTKNGFENLEML